MHNDAHQDSNARSKEAGAVDSNQTDIWEDTMCMGWLREGSVPDEVSSQEKRRVRKRAKHYCWKEGKLYFKGLCVPKPEERMELVTQMHNRHLNRCSSSFCFPIECHFSPFIWMTSWQVYACPTIDHLFQFIGTLKFYSYTTRWATHFSFCHTSCKQTICWKVMYVPHTYCFQVEFCTQTCINVTTPFHTNCSSSIKGYKWPKTH